MKRLFLSFGALMLTFVIGVYANVVAFRAAYRFVPDVNSQSAVPNQLPQFVECGRNKHWRDLEDINNHLRTLPKHLAKKLPKDGRVEIQFSSSDLNEFTVFVDENRSFKVRRQPK